MCVVRTLLYIDIGSVSVFTSDETEVSPTASVWLILCASLVCIRAVKRGYKNLGFYFFSKNPKNLKSPNFTFLGF